MAPRSERNPRNNARKAAARKVQQDNPGMGYREALSRVVLQPESAAQILHRADQVIAAFDAMIAASENLRVRRSAPDEPYVTAEIDHAGKLT